MGEGGRARDRETTQREVDKLRWSIQTLTRWADTDTDTDTEGGGQTERKHPDVDRVVR